jgi:hypothetical protein
MHNCQNGTIFDILQKLMVQDHFTFPFSKDVFYIVHTFASFMDVPIKLYEKWNM